MPSTAEMDEWRATWLQVYIWWCGDEHCDCTQPVVERVTPNIEAWYPWIHRERLWEGTFMSSNGYGLEVDEQELRDRELDEAAAEYGIALNEQRFGSRRLL